jgi:hypothetical protein
MASTLWDAARLLLTPCLLHLLSLTAAQAQPGSSQWQDPLSLAGGTVGSAPELLVQSAPPARSSMSVTSSSRGQEQLARNLASKYLALWSAPKQVTLASASSLYAPTVMFHGRRRTLASVVAEKRRFARRWPHRQYGHRPETTQVACSNDRQCTVRASFDFAVTDAQGNRRSRGIGEHELVVSFAGGRAMIAAEDSRVIIRGHGNMTQFLDSRF